MAEIPRTFALRLLKGSWGIAIDLRAQARVADEAPAGVIQAGKRTWLDVSRVQIGAADIAQLAFGLGLASPGIESHVATGHVVVEVQQVDYTPTDYQAEGMAAAMLGWAQEEFDLDPQDVDVDFDRDANRYVFRW